MTTESTTPPQALVDEAREATEGRPVFTGARPAMEAIRYRDDLIRRLADALSQSNARLEEAAEALTVARADVESWSAYADPYFQTKHDLAGDLARIDAAIAKLKGGK